jgi:type III restriction enzyme
LQKRLELQAIEEEKKGGKYIRPIVLFQAQPQKRKRLFERRRRKIKRSETERKTH